MKKYFPVLFILILTTIILGVQFFTKHGTYFLLDGGFSPIYNFQGLFEVSIFWHLNTLFTIIFGYSLYSKIFLFGTVFFTGLLGLKFSELFIKYFEINNKYKSIVSYSSILFFLLNPFFYERTITQPGISLAFCLIGFGFYFLLKNIIQITNIKNFIYSGVLFGIAFSIMNHSLFLVGLIYTLYALFYIRDKKHFLLLAGSGVIFLFINSNWLIGNFFLNTGNTLSYVNSINQANIDNFTTNSLSNLGEEITSLLLYGFWGERRNHLLLPEIMNTKWYISGFIMFFIMIYGCFKLILEKKYKKISLFLVTLGTISYILGVGITAKWGFISQFLYDYIPFYNGLREPQKWVGLLVMVYSIFFMYGIYNLYLYIEKIIKFKYLNILSIFIIFLFLNGWSPNMLLGFNHQLFISDFPKEYFEIRTKEIKTNYKENKYLILPWHSYMSCDYTKGRVVANVIGGILKPLNTITSDNIEVGNLYTNSSNIESKDIEKFLSNKDINLLKKHKITHIIMLETCADFKNYKEKLNKLEKKNIIKKLQNNKRITLYKIK